MTATHHGPGRIAGLGVLLLFLFVLLASWLGYRAWQDFRLLVRFRPAQGTILDERVSGSGRFQHPEFELQCADRDHAWRARGFDDRAEALSLVSRHQAKAVLDRFEVGRTYPCWYDPEDPSRVVLVRKKSWLYLLVPLAAAGSLAGAALVRRAEARAARRRREGAGTEPGRVLARALTPRWEFLPAAGKHLFANLAVLALVVPTCWETAEEWLLGWPDFMVSLLLAPLPIVAACVAGVSAWEVCRLAYAALAGGRTTLEVSDAEPAADSPFDILAVRTGGVRVTDLIVQLVCEEDAGARMLTRQLARCPIEARELQVNAWVTDDERKSVGEAANWQIVIGARLPLGVRFVRRFPLRGVRPR